MLRNSAERDGLLEGKPENIEAWLNPDPKDPGACPANNHSVTPT